MAEPTNGDIGSETQAMLASRTGQSGRRPTVGTGQANAQGRTVQDDVEQAPLISSSSKDGDDADDNPSSSSSPTAGSTSSKLDDRWRSVTAITSGSVVAACTLYSFCSVSMVLTNKSLASSYNHLIDGDLNILLVVFQAVVAVVCVETCKHLKLVEYPNFSMEMAKQWAPVNIFFCLMLFTSMASLEYNSVPMVTIFKNVTNIITTFGDFFFFGSHVEFLVMVAFGIMLTGAVSAAWNDIDVTWRGIFWMACNCVSTSGYVLYMKYATKTIKISKFGMVFLNNVLAVFFLLPASLLMGEVALFLKTPGIHTPDYTVKNLFAGFVGFFLNFASLNCVSVTGPTTYAIVGSVNKIPVAFLGYLWFDSVITLETWTFICISMAGGFLYSYAKLRTSRQKSRT